MNTGRLVLACGAAALTAVVATGCSSTVSGTAIAASGSSATTTTSGGSAGTTTRTTTATTSASQPTTSAVSIFDFAAGMCFDDDFSGDLSGRFNSVPCDQPHTHEVFADKALQPNEFNAATIESDASAFCSAQFESFVGVRILSSDLDEQSFYPSEGSWANGDNMIVCLLSDPSGADLVGSMRGSGR